MDFSLGYAGPTKIKRRAHNLKLRIGSPTELWNKIMVEVKAKRYAGPFKKVPYKYFIQVSSWTGSKGQRKENPD